MKISATLKYLHTMFLFFFVFIFQDCASKIGWKIAALFDYSRIDGDGTFMNVSVHHIVMALATLGVLYILYRWKNIDFKITFKADACGIKYAQIYCLACLIYYVIWYLVLGFMLDSIAEYDYELNAINVLGTLGFQLFLSCTEELIFRALPIGCFKAIWSKRGKLGDATILLITSLLFTIVHISVWQCLFVSMV